MAGIYIHIPFCKQACTYCNFHFSTSRKNREQILSTILKEIALRKGYLDKQTIESIYFGGGTPSILSEIELGAIFSQLEKHFDLSGLKEVTLEANPDDLNNKKLRELKSLPIDRFSIGIQSTHQDELDFMNRAHNASEGIDSVKRSQDAGFEKISVDLIFGIPNGTIQKWEENLERIFELNVPHLSAYALTLEEKTVYHHLVKSGKYTAPKEDELAEQYNLLQNYISDNNWEQYELSNYCQGEKYAFHNSSYWKDELYLGIGPSAHSYNGKSRQWNLANNQAYSKGLKRATNYFETEELSEENRYHETLISRLRTKWGLPQKFMTENFSEKVNEHFEKQAESLSEYLVLTNGVYQIPKDYWFTSDNILQKLMLDD